MTMNIIKILKENKKSIIEQSVEWIKKSYPNRTTEFEKCYRDIGYVYDAWIYDLENTNTARTQNITSRFWNRGKSQLRTTDVEVKTYKIINTLINEICPSVEVDSLVSITINNILNKPIYELGSFEYLANNRINTYNWTDQIPEQHLIDDIVRGIHNYVPSKQRRVRYDLRIIPTHTLPELQQKMYKGTEADPGNPKSRYNPQVLAPYVLAFGIRGTPQDGVDKNYYLYEAGVEIGLAAMYVSLAAPAVGLAVGFCACIQNDNDMVEDIGIHPQLYLGIGYKSEALTYHCPVYNAEAGIPDSNNYKKPPIEEYIKYV